MMSAAGRRATNQKETHHDPTIQEVITYSVRVQVSYRVLSEVSLSDLEGCDYGYDIRTIQELLGHKDVKTTMKCTYVLQRGRFAVKSPLDG